MREPLFYDRQGNPVELGDYNRLRYGGSDPESYLRVGLDDVGRHRVSTVWLGIDMGFGRTDRPLIFETMLLPECEVLARVATEAEASAEHDRAVAALRSGAEDFVCDPSTHDEGEAR